MWRLEPSDEYRRKLRWYAKKRPAELKAVLTNLERFFKLLQSGRKPRPLPCGFLKDEGLGVLRISEAGSPTKVAATRLYVYPETDLETLFLLALGDKASQARDIRTSKRFVKEIQADPGAWEAGTDEHDEGGGEDGGEGEGEGGRREGA